jgi:riboflavin kinase/FMN adenylyltransferase
VRELLLNGQVCKASELLGRQYRVSGEIVHGDGRGKTIGFPTANIQLNAAYVVPARGVYAVRLYMRDRRYDGVMNIGIKPTFTSGTVEETLEVHLFDFHDDIYGQLASVEFISYLRPEQRFSSVDQLIDQIKRDADQSRSLLSQLG